MSRRRCGVSFLGACACALVLAACWSVPRPAAPSRELRLGLRVETLRLDNGLRVVLAIDPEATQASVTMRYRVGTSDEPAGRAGIAHLAEHVLYEPVRGGRALFDELLDVALDFNGYTTLDATTFTARGWPAQLEALLAIEATRLEQRCSAISEAAFARQREIVRNELREAGAHHAVEAALRHALFPAAHPFHRAAVATTETVAAITRADVCAFIDARYAPHNAVLVVSGPFAREHVERALAATLQRVRHDGVPPAAVADAIPPATARGAVTVRAPVDQPHLVLAWPLPADPVQRARTLAVIRMIAPVIGADVDGEVEILEIGSARAGVVAIAIRPAPGATPQAVLAGAKRAMWRLGDWFASGMFEAARARALYALLATFEDGIDREIHLAEAAFAGAALPASLRAQLDGLRALDRDAAETLAERLELEDAMIVTVEPASEGGPTGVATLAKPPHDLRTPLVEDPRAAQVPAAPPVARELEGSHARVLANGLRVVLLPHASVGTVDIRVVFPVGSGNERADQRGVALLAAHGLQPDGIDAADMLKFYMAGGSIDVDVGVEQTAFIVRGLDAHLDLLLIGLARVLRTGGYADLGETRRWLAQQANADVEDVAATLAWHRALYGEDHPYAGAGVWQRATVRDLGAVRAFQTASYVPDGATLIIAGGFDPDVADRWIAYAFGDWQQARTSRPAARAQLRPFAFAQHTDATQVSARIALPAHGGPVVALVTTEMIAQAFADVRQELAASYGVGAALVELPASRMIAIHGEVDATRAAAAFTLMRERLARLREPSDDTAARFVAARRRVMNRLLAVSTRPSSLAVWAQRDLGLGRGIGSDLHTARAVANLTLPKLTSALAKLELDAAAILVRGPRDAVDAAFDALGRRGTPIAR